MAAPAYSLPFDFLAVADLLRLQVAWLQAFCSAGPVLILSLSLVPASGPVLHPPQLTAQGQGGAGGD